MEKAEKPSKSKGQIETFPSFMWNSTENLAIR